VAEPAEPPVEAPAAPPVPPDFLSSSSLPQLTTAKPTIKATVNFFIVYSKLFLHV
jgi:hypothetical protein